MKIIDNTPIKDFNEDWGDPDGTGMKEKSKEQVQKFIKKKIKSIEEESVSLKNDNDSFKNSVNNQMSEQTEEINSFKRSVSDQIENYKPVEIHGDVTNAPDGEDLTTDENRLLKIANRSTLFGKGYKILRRGVDLASQLNQKNTIYEIRYDFDLGGNTIKIPSGCTLMFTGGSFDNGCLLGDNTAIVAGAYKIFGDNLILNDYCFSRKDGNIGEINVHLYWHDVKNRILSTANVSGKNWILTSDGTIRNSNTQNSTFRENNGTLKADCEFLLQHNPGNFISIDKNDKSAGYNYKYHVLNVLNSLHVLDISMYINNDIFTIPPFADWCFFKSNNEQDDLNDTVLRAGEVINLNEQVIYFTYLNRPMIYTDNSTFCTQGKLEWFVGDNYAKYLYDMEGIADQTYNVQKALDCSMDISSHIKGVLKVSDTLYLEVNKKINLGQRFDLNNMSGFVSNARLLTKFAIPTTIISIYANKDLICQRNTVDFSGGLLTSYFYQGHQSNIWDIDMDYSSSYSNIETSILGNKDYNTNAAIMIDTAYKKEAYNSFSTFNVFTRYTRYGLYALQRLSPSSYYNTSTLNINVFGYYEGVHIDTYGAIGTYMLESSTLNIVLQADKSLDEAIVDNYRNAYIYTHRCTINVMNWDFNTQLKSGKQGPYRKVFIKGDNYLFGNTRLYNSKEAFVDYVDNNYSANERTIVTKTIDTPLGLPLLENVFGGITAKMIKPNASYYKKVSCVSSVDVSKFNDCITDSLEQYSAENITTSIFVLEYLFSVRTGMLSNTALNSNQFVELYVELKDDYTLDKNEKFRKIAFDWGTSSNVFENAKVILFKKDGSKYIKDVTLEKGQRYALFDMSLSPLSNIRACLIRLYGKSENNWGVGENLESTYLMPQLRGFSDHESCNYFHRNFQPITYDTTSYRPSSDIIQGQMYFDSTIKKPIWWTGTAWVDASGSAV